MSRYGTLYKYVFPCELNSLYTFEQNVLKVLVASYTCIIFMNLIPYAYLTFLFPVPPPNVSIMFTQPGVSYYGSQTNISCVLAISPAVNSPVMINLWLIGPQGQIKFDARNMITEPQVLTDYRTTLQISSLNTNDGGLYQCVGNIFSNSSNIVASINASANITLSVQGENTNETRPLMLTPSLPSPALPPPVVTTSSYGSTIAGSVYSLVCMVKVVDGLVVVPDVVWMKDGRVLVNRTNTTLTRTVSGGNSTLNLTFNPLLTSHGGQYICVSQLFHNVTTSTAVSVSVQSEFDKSSMSYY